MLKAISVLKQCGNIERVGLNFPKDHVFLSATEFSLFKTPCRTTFILRRKYPVPLVKKTVDTDKWKLKRRRDRTYEVEQYTEIIPEGEIKVILTAYVEGLGEKNDVVSVKRTYAYNKLLLLGLAEYATPEALENLELDKSKTKESKKVEERLYSGIHVQRTMNVLSSLIIGITMNKENKWVIEPWHVRAAFRKAGVHLKEDCIELPKERIEGPDMNLEGKEFFVTVTINKKEKVKVRCRIHHWSTDIIHRLPNVPFHWTLPAEPLFENEAELLTSMPLPPVPKSKSSDRM